jgi:hypothetical protein
MRDPVAQARDLPTQAQQFLMFPLGPARHIGIRRLVGGALVIGLERGQVGSLLPQSRILGTQLGQALPLQEERNSQSQYDDGHKTQPEFGR